MKLKNVQTDDPEISGDWQSIRCYRVFYGEVFRVRLERPNLSLLFQLDPDTGVFSEVAENSFGRAGKGGRLRGQTSGSRSFRYLGPIQRRGAKAWIRASDLIAAGGTG